MPKYTPMMEQYLKIKEEYKNCLLFFRLGDFYELFFDDALTASKELEITLTGKDCGMKDRAPMCGVPFHSSDGYIAKLVEKGYKVAICEQMEDPKKTKTLVKREVIRVITPGTVLDSTVLEEGKNNYIMSIYADNKGFALSTADVSTGEFTATEFKAAEGNKIIDEVARFNPAEIIANEENELTDSINKIFDVKTAVYDKWAFDYENAFSCLCSHFKTLNLKGFGFKEDEISVRSSGALLDYLTQTQKNSLSHITSIKKYNLEKYMVLDLSSRRNLEITRSIRDNEKKGSLLWVLDKTKTSMGARLMRKWLEQPLIDIKEINKRLDGVEKFRDEVFTREELKEVLNTVYDIERLMSKVVYATANARDMVNLRNSFKNLPYIKELLPNFASGIVDEIYKAFDALEDIYALLEASLADEPPFTLREGGIIKEGYNEEADRLRKAKREGSQWLTELEAKERELTGIKNLKIRFNKVFGYYIEVTNSNLSLVPDRYIRKQTLTNAERFITEELKKIEDTILGADEKVTELEYNIFCGIRSSVADSISRIQKTAHSIAVIDVLAAFGEVADREEYSKPKVTEEGVINIIDGRHPVVEKMNRDDFIPNDTFLDLEDNRLAVITGPNMAGKSTYMRQSALIVLMAQAGSFVPATYAEIGICDRIFTRVGASDDLATGQSTFMVEMSEVANILNNATSKSLLILDEIGRGTSTFDGLSIAWAVLEEIADKKKVGARTLFATHYHELTELENRVGGIVNYCVSVEEKGDDVIFLRKIIKGSADKSYGIHVAKLAGVPKSVLKRAEEILSAIVADGFEKTPVGRLMMEKLMEEEDNGDFVYTQKSLPRKKLFVTENDDYLYDSEESEECGASPQTKQTVRAMRRKR